MAETELDDFLKTEEAEPEAVAVVAEAETAQAETPEDGEQEATPTPGDSRTVPLAALEGERKARQDWKEKAIRAEGETAELRRQLEEARRPAPAPVAYQPPAPVNPAEDPAGYHERIQQVVLNERLNTSEMMVRDKMGAEKTDAIITEFKALAQADPTLFGKLYQQPHPYEWAHREVEKAKAMREIGEDPAAYRERVRAELQAELQAAPEPARQATTLPPPSLANARSAAPRSAPAYSGPSELRDILPRG